LNLPPPEIHDQRTEEYTTSEPTEPMEPIDPAYLVNGKIPAGMLFQKASWTRCEYQKSGDGDAYVILGDGCAVYVVVRICWRVTEIRFKMATGSLRVSYKEVELSRKTAYIVNCPDGSIGVLDWSTTPGLWPPPIEIMPPQVQQTEPLLLHGERVNRRTDTYWQLDPPARIVPPCTVEAAYVLMRRTSVVRDSDGKTIDGPTETEYEPQQKDVKRWPIPNCEEQLTPRLIKTTRNERGE
jgi:hypothetical protein